jgi:uncharacterized membrane protein YkoI
MIAVCLALASPAFAKKSRKPPGTIVPWKEVPATVQAGVQTNAAGAKVKEVQKITAANGAIVYCAEVKQTDGKWAKIYVNNSGTLIKTEQDNARNKRKHKPLFDF